MDFGIKNKKALVTGAGRGLGESIALNLAKEGAAVAVVSRTEKELKKLVDKMGGGNKGHYFIVSDLTAEGEPERVYKKLLVEFGQPEILVNNLGGTLEVRDPFCGISDWRRVWRINMEVALELNNLVLPAMMKKKWGRIVNITSISALENQGPVTYCSIKAALLAYTRSMGRVVSSSGVVMTSLLPGAVMTKDGYWDIASKTKPEHVKKYLSERMAIKRFGKPDEIGAVVAFLCSRQASFFVGSAVTVDGGQGRCFF